MVPTVAPELSDYIFLRDSLGAKFLGHCGYNFVVSVRKRAHPASAAPESPTNQCDLAGEFGRVDLGWFYLSTGCARARPVGVAPEPPSNCEELVGGLNRSPPSF
jgi:hypothetical protein